MMSHPWVKSNRKISIFLFLLFKTNYRLAKDSDSSLLCSRICDYEITLSYSCESPGNMINIDKHEVLFFRNFEDPIDVCFSLIDFCV